MPQIYTTEQKPSVKRKAVDTNPCGGRAISKRELNHILFSMKLPTFNLPESVESLRQQLREAYKYTFYIKRKADSENQL